MLEAVASYLGVLIVAVLTVLNVLRLFKRLDRRFSPLRALFGALGFGIVAVVFIMIIPRAFSADAVDVVKASASEAAYKITVVLLLLAGMGLVRYFALNAVYFDKDAQDKGISFMSGFGMGGLLILCAYCVFMLTALCCFSLAYGDCDLQYALNDESSIFVFDSGATLSVFTPFSDHVVLAVILAVYALHCLLIAVFMDKRSRAPYGRIKTLVMYIFTHAGEAMLVCLMLFRAWFTAQFALGVFVAVCEAFALRFYYKYEKEQPYERQFKD